MQIHEYQDEGTITEEVLKWEDFPLSGSFLDSIADPQFAWRRVNKPVSSKNT
tara:strand:+ start:759 stop:914 length:156 start_codon:yes stop_codon:yes gene_type:complete